MPTDGTAGYHRKCYQLYTNQKTLEKFPALDETELSRRTSRDRSVAGKYNFCLLISNLCSSNTLSPKMDHRVEKRGANITNFHPNQIFLVILSFSIAVVPSFRLIEPFLSLSSIRLVLNILC